MTTLFTTLTNDTDVKYLSKKKYWKNTSAKSFADLISKIIYIDSIWGIGKLIPLWKYPIIKELLADEIIPSFLSRKLLQSARRVRWNKAWRPYNAICINNLLIYALFWITLRLIASAAWQSKLWNQNDYSFQTHSFKNECKN